MTDGPFIPHDFAVPTKLETERFRLRPLTVEDTAKDYEAVMETQAYFHSLGYQWPEPGFTMNNNREDLEQHQREFENREAFAYTVVVPDESRVLGCVYIDPCDDPETDAAVSMWVRDSEQQSDLKMVLFESVKRWIDKEWPFDQVIYA